VGKMKEGREEAKEGGREGGREGGVEAYHVEVGVDLDGGGSHAHHLQEKAEGGGGHTFA